MPRPDSLTPRNGTSGVVIRPSLTPVLQSFHHAEGATETAGVEVGREAELGVVGERRARPETWVTFCTGHG